MIEYSLIDCDFEILGFKDGKEEHIDNSGRKYFKLVWGLESTLGRDLSNYYYFYVNRMNVEKGVVPGKAFVNGVEAETIREYDGEYLIQRDLVQEPLEIRVESVPALYVTFRGLQRRRPTLGMAGKKVVIHFDASDMDRFTANKGKPVFAFYRKKDNAPIELKDFEFINNPVMPWAQFTMPEFDVEIEVTKGMDESKQTLTIDSSAIDAYLVGSWQSSVVSEAIFSDDYDFGIEDHHFFEGKIVFKKGTRLKVEFILSEKRNVVCCLNGEIYSPKRCVETVYRDEEDEEQKGFEYRFEVVFKGEDTLSFKI